MADAGGGDPPKVSIGFKIQGKARPSVSVNVKEKEEHRQLITGVAGNRIQAAEPEEAAAGQKQYVIPRLENTYKTGVGKFVPTFVPESSSAAITGNAEDRYERAAAPDQPALTSFGLEVRQRKPKEESGGGGSSEAANGAAAEAAPPPVPPALAPAAALRGDDAAQLKADLEALPDEASVEDYESLPVEEFGRALLRGLGWTDGQGVGRKRQLVEPKQAVRRPDRLGLGANPVAAPPDKRPRKMGDKPRQDLVAAPAADGSARHRVGLDERLVPRESTLPGPQAGKAMDVVAGRHAGLACIVRELLGGGGGGAAAGAAAQRVRVELQPSCEVVEVSADELADKGAPPRPGSAPGGGGGSREANGGGSRGGGGGSSRERSREKDGARDRGRDKDRERDRDRGGDKERSSRDRDRDRDGGRRRERSRSRERPQHSSGGGGGGRERPPRPPAPPARLWLAPQIRVRVVDKALQGGALYLRKGVVLDVAPGGTADVQLEEGRRVVRAHQDQLETVVPREPGAAVMVVAGRHRGRKGRLLQVSHSAGAAALQLVGDMAVERVLLDDVAQFVGHLEEED